MSKGTVKSTPIVTKAGIISVTEASVNTFRVVKGASLSFDAPPGLNVGDTVEIDITSASTCNVVKVIQPAAS